MLPTVLLAAACAGGMGAAATAGDAAYRNEIEDWRRGRVERLTEPDGWLTLVGLDWLNEGRNALGSAPGNSIVQAKWPPHLGTVTLEHGKATIKLASADATIDGMRETTAVLRDDSDPKREPTVVASGSVSFFVIHRSNLYGLRIKDSEAATRRHFAGFDYFPIDPSWRIVAKWEAYDPPHEVEEGNEIGKIDKVVVPGAAVFTRDGKTFRVEPIIEVPGDRKLYLVFSDRTSGKETYGASRSLYTDPPKDGRIVIDFNKAYNPPCAFTPYATCLLPTQQNRLDLRVTAGEKKYRGAAD